MTGTKITELTSTASVVTADALVVVDVSDSSMSAQGTDKQITAGHLAESLVSLAGLGAGATLGTSQIIRFIIDGGGSTLTTGAKKAYVTMPWSCTITSWNILPDQSGSIVLDLWKDSYANYPPTVADTITGSAKPTLTATTKATSSTLTGWTTTLTAGDVLEINVDSVATCTKVILELLVTRTS